MKQFYNKRTKEVETPKNQTVVEMYLRDTDRYELIGDVGETVYPDAPKREMPKSTPKKVAKKAKTIKQTGNEYSKMSWKDLVKLGKEHGIKTFGVKRPDLEKQIAKAEK